MSDIVNSTKGSIFFDYFFSRCAIIKNIKPFDKFDIKCYYNNVIYKIGGINMKKSLKKIMAGVSAAAMLASAMPIASAFAAEETETTFSVKEVADGVVITDYSDKTAEKIVIPSEIDGKTVVGVDNFAFGLISQDVTIVVPATLKLDNIGDEAFMTAAVVNEGLIKVSGASTINGIVKYWVNDVAGMNYTDEQIGDAVVRAMSHIGNIDVTDMTVESLAIKVVKEIQAGNCGFSQANLDRLDLALATLPYTPVTLEGADGTDAQKFAAGKVSLVYNVTGSIMKGDATLDGKVDFFDALAIARTLVPGATPLEGDAAIAADYDSDGDVDLFDLLAVARTLVK